MKAECPNLARVDNQSMLTPYTDLLEQSELKSLASEKSKGSKESLPVSRASNRAEISSNYIGGKREVFKKKSNGGKISVAKFKRNEDNKSLRGEINTKMKKKRKRNFISRGSVINKAELKEKTGDKKSASKNLKNGKFSVTKAKPLVVKQEEEEFVVKLEDELECNKYEEGQQKELLGRREIKLEDVENQENTKIKIEE